MGVGLGYPLAFTALACTTRLLMEAVYSLWGYMTRLPPEGGCLAICLALEFFVSLI